MVMVEKLLLSSALQKIWLQYFHFDGIGEFLSMLNRTRLAISFRVKNATTLTHRI